MFVPLMTSSRLTDPATPHLRQASKLRISTRKPIHNMRQTMRQPVLFKDNLSHNRATRRFPMHRLKLARARPVPTLLDEDPRVRS